METDTMNLEESLTVASRIYWPGGELDAEEKKAVQFLINHADSLQSENTRLLAEVEELRAWADRCKRFTEDSIEICNDNVTGSAKKVAAVRELLIAVLEVSRESPSLSLTTLQAKCLEEVAEELMDDEEVGSCLEAADWLRSRAKAIREQAGEGL